MSNINTHISSNSYRPDIDGLRALAIIFVVIYHAFPSVVTELTPSSWTVWLG